jgi:hypothetical protein
MKSFEDLFNGVNRKFHCVAGVDTPRVAAAELAVQLICCRALTQTNPIITTDLRDALRYFPVDTVLHPGFTVG